MKNIKRTILIGLAVGGVFFGWILYGFYSQNWNFNLFSVRDWAYVWNEFVSGWIISATSDWIFVITILCAIPVFIVLWRLFCHVSWGKIYQFLRRQITRLLQRGKPTQVVQKKIKLKSRQSHKKVRPRPMNTTGRPLPKVAGKTMDGNADIPMSAENPATADITPHEPEVRPAFLDEDISNISLDDIHLPERDRLDEDLVALLSDANYQVVQDVTLDGVRLAYIGVSADKIVLCQKDMEKGDWLADEDSFNDEEPFWFSESSDRISPIYQLLEVTKAFSDKVAKSGYTQVVKPIFIEQEGNIINAEDMMDTWEKSGVIVCRTGLGGPDELPSFGTALPVAEDRGTSRDLESIRGLF